MTYTYHYHSPLGDITISSNGTAITGLWFDGQKYFGAGLAKNCEEKELAVFEEAKRWLDIYFSGKEPGFIDGDDSIPQRGMGNSAYDSVRADDDLRRDCGQDCKAEGA